MVKLFSDQPGISTSFAVTVLNAAGEYFNVLTGAFEAYDAGNWTATEYLIAVTEPGKPGSYRWTVPAALPGTADAPVAYSYVVWMLPGTTSAPSAANDVPWTQPTPLTWAGNTVGEVLDPYGSIEVELTEVRA